jgi:hypothetical protein
VISKEDVQLIDRVITDVNVPGYVIPAQPRIVTSMNTTVTFPSDAGAWSSVAAGGKDMVTLVWPRGGAQAELRKQADRCPNHDRSAILPDSWTGIETNKQSNGTEVTACVDLPMGGTLRAHFIFEPDAPFIPLSRAMLDAVARSLGIVAITPTPGTATPSVGDSPPTSTTPPPVSSPVEPSGEPTKPTPEQPEPPEPPEPGSARHPPLIDGYRIGVHQLAPANKGTIESGYGASLALDSRIGTEDLDLFGSAELGYDSKSSWLFDGRIGAGLRKMFDDGGVSIHATVGVDGIGLGGDAMATDKIHLDTNPYYGGEAKATFHTVDFGFGYFARHASDAGSEYRIDFGYHLFTDGYKHRRIGFRYTSYASLAHVVTLSLGF